MVFDKRQGKTSQEQQHQQPELDKGQLPDGKREEVRRFQPVDTRKGGQVLQDPNFGKRPNDYGRDAVLDPMRQAKPEMMAVVSVMIPELSNTRSPQAAALMREFENPAVLRSYLINPEKTAQLLGQKYPDMRDALSKNAPFVQEGSHLRENKSSGLYARISQEVAQGINPDKSFVRHHMDKLLSSPIPAALGGSAGLETQAYELLRNRAENKDFNAAGARIEHTISKLMRSPRAREDLKEVAGLASARPSPQTQTGKPAPTASQPVKEAAPQPGVPTTTGKQVQGPLKPVAGPTPGAAAQPQMAAPPASTELPKMVQAKESPAVGGANPTSIPTPAPIKPGAGIPVPEIKSAGVPTTNGSTVTGPLNIVNPQTPSSAPRPPLISAMDPSPAVPLVGGGTVSGDLKMVPPGPDAKSTPQIKPPAAPEPKAAPMPEQKAAPMPDQKPAATPEQKPPVAPVPDQLLKAQTQQMEATIAKLEESLKKATDTTEAMMKKLQESENRNADLMKRLEESERRAQRMELKSDVNDILREQKQKTASGKEIDEAITAATKPEQKELPSPEQVVTKVTELREQAKQKEIQAQKDLAKKINESFATLPAGANVAQTREWTTKNMALHDSLDDKGRKAFTNYIQNTYQFKQDRETFDPMTFFNRKIADAAGLEISNATRARQVYIPSGGSIPNGMPPTLTTFYEPDPVRIAEVLRSVSDLKDVLPHVQANPAVQAARDKLPKDGMIFKEDGVHQKSIDARLAGNRIEAEALLLRSLVESGDMKDTAQRKKVIREALGPDKAQSDQIRALYREKFETDLFADLKKANARQLDERDSAAAEVKKQEEALQKARDKAKAAAEKVDDLME
jgi:hypothetical protein